jgi:glyoxylase-like metal-dependent hydrolase (beta-lactamase superfamily II)
MQKQLVIHTIVSQAFAQNAYAAHLDGNDACVIIDPGFDAEAIEAQLNRHQLTPRAVLNTHGHIDHIAGNGWMKRCWADCPIVIGKEEADKLVDPESNLSGQYGMGLTSPPADVLVSDGDTYEAAGLVFDVVAVPGHSKGHVIYTWKGDTPWVVFGGDVLFRGGVGRSDFPDGNTELLFTSIRNKIFTMPGDTLILPGHGESTTVEAEKRHNPFVGDRVFPDM